MRVCGLKPAAREVLDQKLNIHGDVTLIHLVVPLRHNALLMDARPQFRLHKVREG